MSSYLNEEIIEERFKLYVRIEDLVFSATKESLEEAKNIILQNKDNIPVNYIYSLVVYVASIKAYSYRDLSDFLLDIGMSTTTFAKSSFTEYLVKRGIINEDQLPCQLQKY